jgi:hypothetical protein
MQALVPVPEGGPDPGLDYILQTNDANSLSSKKKNRNRDAGAGTGTGRKPGSGI